MNDKVTDATALPPGRWINRYAALDAQLGGGVLGTPVQAGPFPGAHWIARSDDCARLLGLPEGWHGQPGALEALSGQQPWPGSAPWATVYSGHQFGQWAGQLGDGRALMLGELATPGGASFELQLKGAGKTPYSRMGDGRAVLRSSIREFLCSEAMAALGVPTTRALALVGSPLPVRRETLETAAIVTRVAPSFLRVGHFEHFCHHGQHDTLRALVAHTLQAHFPACIAAEGPLAEASVAAWLAEVTRRSARLVAHWQALGFCHGVLNTDNLSVLGLTIDYGPFGFLDAYDPGHICNHSDHAGRYAFARQPNVVWWNLHALAHALRPLFADPDAVLPGVLAAFEDDFHAAFNGHLAAKFGWAASSAPQAPDGEAEDGALANEFLALLAAGHVDHTIAFRRLAACSAGATQAPDTLRDLFIDRPALDAWAQRYQARLAQRGWADAPRRASMQAHNPKYILRNHLAQAAIDRAAAGDFSEVQRLLGVLSRPFDEQPAHEADAGFPPDWARQLEVSCSS